jgi:uncharacterized membrane-anchored protein
MHILRSLATIVAMWAIAISAHAEAPTHQAELEAAVDAANAAIQPGPRKIPVAGQAQLDLPKGYGFIPSAPAAKLLKAMGNRPGDDLAGLITPEDESGWFMVVRYIASGYIKDDDARDWKADDLIKSIREGTEQTNGERKSRGLPEMEIVGWVEPPHYQADTHRLVWSLESKAKGAPPNADNGINYNTLVLGREGYVSMNLVTDLKEIEARKPVAQTLLAALAFDEGRRYADFNSNTDKVAEYGLAALVAGVAAKKLGLFAVIAAFALKFAKVIGIAAVAGAAGLTSLFRRKKAQATPTDQA